MESLKKLEGKLAIRKEPVKLGKNNFGYENYDYSYTTTPIRILKVTENHIIYDHKGTKEENIFKSTGILDKRWIDNNWIDYKKLVEAKYETTR